MNMQSIAIEYSVSTNQFYYDTLENIIKRNLNAIKNNTSNDYKVIGICKNIDEVSYYIENIKNNVLKGNI